MRHPLPLFISLEHTRDPVGTLQSEFSLTPDETSLCRKLLESHMPPLVRPEILSFLFGVSYRLILSMARNQDLHYRRFRIRKSRGGYRQIEAPRRYLKLTQRWINAHILRKVKVPRSVHGFVPGKNIFTNAQRHLPSKNLMVIDVKDFFPSVSEREVKGIFKNLGYHRRVVNRLTELCTYEGRLPQGAPTSPALANICFAPIDIQLQRLARSWRCKYSRYADDLAFSGQRHFTQRDVRRVGQILNAHGFRINRQKSRIIGSGGRQILAGLVVNQTGLPPRRTRRIWRAMFHQANLNPAGFREQAPKLHGIAAFVNEYNIQLASAYFAIARQTGDQN